jgi:N-acyl-D-aspartate/D-glutamate deacylase
MHDVVIRAGSVIDGTGDARRTADLAIDGGTITSVGRVDERGRREIDADGLVVAPGFVDVHTHYDGQATWSSRLDPSSWHGVTTVVMGNCGVGFAPVHAHHHERLIELMEGVEDIPGTALHEGLAWNWSSFPEFLDALDALPHDIDIAAQIPHSALRLHVMGERGADHDEVPTPEEIATMGAIAAEAIAAGALGFTTSRTRNHRSSRGEYIPSLTATHEELVGIAAALRDVGGVLQVVSDFLPSVTEEIELLRSMAAVSGRPLSFSLGQTSPGDGVVALLDTFAAMASDGITIRAQVAPRPVGALFGLMATLNPFGECPSYLAIADLSIADRLASMRQPDRRAAILREVESHPLAIFGRNEAGFDRMYELGDPPNYEPDSSSSVAGRAAAAGRPAAEVAYDIVTGGDGSALLYVPFVNYPDGNLDVPGRLLTHPSAIPGLSDGGAHVGTICDASFPTTLLTHWCRDRTRGELLTLETVIAAQSRRTAEALGLRDRGVIAPGMRADVNVLDIDGMRLAPPSMLHDLPAGGRRLVQRVEGYRHTFVAGVETYASGEPTGALPGRLVRGSR